MIGSFFIPYAEMGSATNIPNCIGSLLKEFLYNQDLPELVEEIELLFNKTPIFCKTVNKKILGHMNDFKRCVDSYIHNSPINRQPVNLDYLSKKINNMPISFSEKNRYIYPIEILGILLGHQLKTKDY